LKIESPLLNKIGGLLGVTAVRTLMGTLDYKAAYYDLATDPATATPHGQRLYLFWHEYVLFPLYLFGHCDVAMLLSRHRDAEILAPSAARRIAAALRRYGNCYGRAGGCT
jgi:lysophospholipid acyltransferase (LPLAT)-like uncharacterized protein